MNGEILVNGIDALTGRYLPAPGTAQELARQAALQLLPPGDLQRLRDLMNPNRPKEEPYRGPIPGVNPLRLDSAGWCVIFAPQAGGEIREALQPLLNLRRKQAGALYQEHICAIGEQPKSDFLSKMKAPLGQADPKRLPYYVLLVGDPRTIPFRFQYELDVQYAVGRLWLDRPEDYESYARGVVRAETEVDPRQPKRLTFFGVANADDRPTQRLCKDLIKPLAQEFERHRGWRVQTHLGAEATKAQLASLLGGDETPTFLFTGSHGLGFPFDGEETQSSTLERQLAEQGALICQDWPGPVAWTGAMRPEHYFAAEDLPPGTDLNGMLAFLFACYSGGTPEHDSFSDETFGEPRRIALNPFVAKLPRRLLASGARAVVAHVDRAWTTTFSQSEDSQPDVFKSVLTKLLNGEPLGWATEYLNSRHAELSVELSHLFQDQYSQMPFRQEHFSRVWRANNDARNFVVLGDPAVRLTVRSTPPDVLRDGRRREQPPLTAMRGPSRGGGSPV